MSIGNVVLALSAAAALLGTANQATGDLLIGNYPPVGTGAGTGIAVPGGMDSKAAGFTLPAGTAYSLDSVQLRLERFDVGATMTLELFADVAGNPGGAPLLSFIVPAFPPGLSDVVFTPAVPFTLMPSTTYWVAATGTSTSPVGIAWRGTSPGITPTGIATSAGFRFSSMGVYPPVGAAAVVNTYLVNATAVPEASSVLCFAVVGLAFAAAITWQSRRTAIGTPINSPVC